MSYITHGDTGTRLYRIWKSMKCRCYLVNHPSYKNYGARGIKVCDEWRDSYPAFKTWALQNGYKQDLELERIDVNRGYTPDNCTWIPHHEQTLNRRDTLYIIINGETHKLRDFCERYYININTVNNWRHLGILEEKLSSAFNTPITITGGKKEVVKV